jgi:hypothetical protein
MMIRIALALGIRTDYGGKPEEYGQIQSTGERGSVF